MFREKNRQKGSGRLGCGGGARFFGGGWECWKGAIAFFLFD